MPETLSELVVEITANAAALQKDLHSATQSLNNWAKHHEQQFRRVGLALVGIGGAITASFGMMAKAAADERVNIGRLSQTLQNLGVSYDDVKDSLEAVISATQRKTGIADSQQRDVLNRLLLVTNDYHKALELLPTVLDLAAAGQMDATTAATYLGKAFLELESGAESVSVRFGQASMQFKSMEDIQMRVAGAAEAMANPFTILSATMGDVAETIGSLVLPAIDDFVNRVTPIIEAVQKWINLNPELAKELAFTALKLAGLSLAIGSILIIVPKLIMFMVSLTGLFGPWGLAIAAVTLAVGYLTAELLGLSDAMGIIKGAMVDIQAEMFRMEVAQAFSAERWAEIQKQGYLTEKQFMSLATAMGLTTSELYDQMVAANMLEVTMKSVGDTNMYLIRTTDEVAKAVEEGTEKIAQFNHALEEGTKKAIATATWAAEGYTYQMSLFTEAEIKAAEAAGKMVERLKTQADALEGMKRAIASATWEAEGYTYQMSLFTEEEIKAAEAAGKKVERLKTQADVMEDNTKAAEKLTDAYKALITMEDIIAARGAGVPSAPPVGMAPGERGEFLAQKIWLPQDIWERFFPGVSFQPGGMTRAQLMGLGITEDIILRAIEEYHRSLGPIEGYQHGGIVTRPTLAMIGEKAPQIKEAVIPETMWDNIGNRLVNIWVELDGRLIATVIGQPLVEEIRLRTGVR